MTDRHASARSAALAELREQATWLANDLSGPLRRINLQSGDVAIEVEWQQLAEPAAEPVHAQPADAPDADGQVLVCSPIVGTFYRAPSPEEAPFVEVGDAVEAGQTVAIVEAMKMFNPIVAEEPGIVTEILVGNGQQVQFGEPLLRLKTAAAAAASTAVNPTGGAG